MKKELDAARERAGYAWAVTLPVVVGALVLGWAAPARAVNPNNGGVAAPGAPAIGGDEAYEHYLLTSTDFQPVKQDKAWCAEAFPSWTVMPWPFHWTIGYDEAAAKWSIDHGYNGVVINGNDVSSEAGPTGKLDFATQHKLRFYVDHLAAKRFLHLWDSGEEKAHMLQIHGTGYRAVPVNDALRQKLQLLIQHNIGAVKSSPLRAAYALDDEASWGHFVHPCMWSVTDDRSAYPAWLASVYGAVRTRNHWYSYEEIRPRLKTWDLSAFDASPVMDQWSFNDSYWCNFLGDLVTYANSVDPETPVGIVGAQCPNAFGGYDYAKLTRKVQFIEAYNTGSSQAIIRSFNPHNSIPAVTTHFHQNSADDIWQTWYYLAHGNRGLIEWVDDGWFDGKTPKPWHQEVAATYREASYRIGPLMRDAEWVHDGIAIYYSHPSIQLGWVLDAEAHGKTWINRNGDDQLGSSHRVRHAWENMIRDSGLQYNFISYVDAVQHGISPEYRVLILPACLCLSDAEAKKIKAFCTAGGTVIADYMPGLWDEHGKGRSAGGVLDDMFGVQHNPKMKPADVFNGPGLKALWCEVDQDANFSVRDPEKFLTQSNTCMKDASGFNKAVRDMGVAHVQKFGNGKAILMNLSPQWYNAYRAQGADAAQARSVFMKPVLESGIGPRFSFYNADSRLFGVETTCWRKGNRMIYFICQNPEITGSQAGGGNSAGLKTGTVPITLLFSRPVTHPRDERTGAMLVDGATFKFNWVLNQAVVLSIDAK